MIAWLVRLLLFLGVYFLLKRVLAFLFGTSRPQPSLKNRGRDQGRQPTLEGKTVKDPECGMYIALSLALPMELKGERLYFCSEKCRDAYRERLQPGVSKG